MKMLLTINRAVSLVNIVLLLLFVNSCNGTTEGIAKSNVKSISEAVDTVEKKEDCIDTVMNRYSGSLNSISLDSIISLYRLNRNVLSTNKTSNNSFELFYCRNRNTLFDSLTSINNEKNRITYNINSIRNTFKNVYYDSLNNFLLISINSKMANDSLIRENAGFFLYNFLDNNLYYLGFGKMRTFDLKSLLIFSKIGSSINIIESQIHISNKEILYVSKPYYIKNNSIYENSIYIYGDFKLTSSTSIKDINMLLEKDNLNKKLYYLFSNNRMGYPLWFWEGYYFFGESPEGPAILK